MDNRSIDIVSEGNPALGLAIDLIWPNAPGGKATHYAEKNNTLILLWGDEGESTKLPYVLNLQRATEFVDGWLANADYGEKPGMDGDIGKGWRLFTDSWGHVNDYHYAIFGVQPIWALYGK